MVILSPDELLRLVQIAYRFNRPGADEPKLLAMAATILGPERTARIENGETCEVDLRDWEPMDREYKKPLRS